jgi:hypothetical protein
VTSCKSHDKPVFLISFHAGSPLGPEQCCPWDGENVRRLEGLRPHLLGDGSNAQMLLVDVSS